MENSNPAFTRIWHTAEEKYRKQNYVPLAERFDWDGEVEVIDVEAEEDPA